MTYTRRFWQIALSRSCRDYATTLDRTFNGVTSGDLRGHRE